MADVPEYSRRSRDIYSDIAVFNSRIEVRVFPGAYDEELVKRIIARVQHIAGDNQYPVLVLPDKNTKISFFAVKALASDAAMNYAKATAYLIRSFHQQLMAESLFKMYTPSKPISVFKEEKDALNWLHTFK
jgi:hypothetical protein